MATTKTQGRVKRFGTSQFSKNGNEKVTTEQLETVDTDGTVVKTGYGCTVSRNYNSVRIDVGVEYPTTKKGMSKAFQRAWDLCSEEMASQMEEANAFLKKLAR